MKCTNCNFENKESAKFCIKCGTPVLKESIQTESKTKVEERVTNDLSGDKRKVVQNNNLESNTNINNSSNSQINTKLDVYSKYFNMNNIDVKEEDYTKNLFFDTFSVGVGILLHFLTFGIFTIIFCGLKHSKLPKIKSDDFSGGKAIGFLFIPFFNFYWLFVFWRRLAMRINFQFRLRNEKSPVSIGLATAICILTFIPYLGGAINFLVLMPILFSQIQSASNTLAIENMRKN